MPVNRKDMEKVPPQHIQRTINLLRHSGPLTAQEVADAMNIKLKTARNYIDLASQHVTVDSYPVYGATKYVVSPTT